jgi:hypothetical protein
MIEAGYDMRGAEGSVSRTTLHDFEQEVEYVELCKLEDQEHLVTHSLTIPTMEV